MKKIVQMKERDEIVTPFRDTLCISYSNANCDTISLTTFSSAQFSIPLFLLMTSKKILNEKPCNLMKPIWYYGKGVHRTG